MLSSIECISCLFQKTLLEKSIFTFQTSFKTASKWSLFRHLVTVFEVTLLIFRIADQITIPNDENENVNETFHLFRPKVRWKLLIFFFPLSLYSLDPLKEKSCKRSSNILFFLCVNQLIVQFIISPRAFKFKNHLRTSATVKCKLWESLNLMLVELLPCVSF